MAVCPNGHGRLQVIRTDQGQKAMSISAYQALANMRSVDVHEAVYRGRKTVCATIDGVLMYAIKGRRKIQGIDVRTQNWTVVRLHKPTASKRKKPQAST